MSIYVCSKRNGLLCGFLLSCCFLLSCGGDDLELGTGKQGSLLQFGRGGANLRFGGQRGGGESGSRHQENIIVKGNVFNLRPATARPVVVFAFVNLRDPGTFQDFADAEFSTIEEDRTFSVTNLAAGDLTVVFLLDGAGVNQDGTIDSADPIATFQDPKGRLTNRVAGDEITLQDVDLVFDLDNTKEGIATVASEANIVIRQQGPVAPSGEES